MPAHTVTADPVAFSALTFDYLVVGGGTAGLVVAARLAEDESVRVGVLEAGRDNRGDTRIDVPGRFGSLVGDAAFDWQFETTPQPGLGNRSLPWPRGRVLGGTSALNFLVWNRGARQDYDAWVALGNPGWGWDDLLPYFKKSETFYPPDEGHQHKFHSAADTRFHGTTGPISTSFAPWYAVTHPFWHDTVRGVGIQKNHSALNGYNVGAWTVIQSVQPATGQRSYAASAYIRDGEQTQAQAGPSLVILTGALVRRIRLEKGAGGLRAVGVAYTVDGKEFAAAATREVVLSAGTVQSPQLLELSGIGDAAVLARAGVAVQHHNANVGRNLQDHLMTSLVYEAEPGTYTPETLAENPAADAAARKVYAEKKDGIYRSSPSSMAYLPLAQFMGAATDTFTQRVAAAVMTTGPLARPHALTQRALCSATVGHVEFILHHGNSGPFTGVLGKRYVTLHQIHQYPFSRGEIHIQSADAAAKPRIDPGYYTPLSSDGLSPDLETMVAAVRFAARIPKEAPLRDLIRKRVLPPSGPDGPASDADWAQFVRDTTITDWHPIGTCAMLPADRGGVVDARLRVHGVQGLRVVDASVLPLHISAHLQATVYAMAEKAADMIREDGAVKPRL